MKKDNTVWKLFGGYLLLLLLMVISRMEFDMKDQLVRQTIMTTQEDVKEIKIQLDKLNDKIDRLR